jgi:hypothetical protein
MHAQTVERTKDGRIDAKENTRLRLRNSTVTLERGPAGTIAKIDRDDTSGIEYAGPIDDTTASALVDVAFRGVRL